MGERPNLNLSEETGEETRDALEKYRAAYGLESREDAIRRLLPAWTINPLVTPTMGKLKEMTTKSHHYDFEVSTLSDAENLADLADEVESSNPELASEIREIIHSE